MLCCAATLQRLRGWKDVEEEMTEMRLEEQSEKAEGQLSVLKLFTFRSLRWQLLSIIFINMGQQLSGVNAIYYYADSIFSSAGVKESQVQYVTVGTGSVNVLMTIAAVFIVEASGTELLLLIGFGICCAACVIFTIALRLQESLGAFSFIVFACICLATFIYILVVIPETKGATFLEISKLFAKMNKVEIVVKDEDCRMQEAGVKDPKMDIITAF